MSSKTQSSTNHAAISREFLSFLLFAFLVFLLFSAVYIYKFYQHFMADLLNFSIAALLGMLLVSIITPIVISVSKKYNFLDRPSTRKLQENPVPLMGGVAIFISFSLVMLIYRPWTPELISILAGSTLLLIIGAIDDVYPLSSTIRLVGQITASLIVISSGLMVSFLPDTLWGNIFAALITIFWILSIVNALNFLDGIDGLATGIAVIASFFFFLITLHQNQGDVSLLSAVIIGCGLGFLIYNFKPAKIYLGDGGSTYLGFILACLTLYGSWSNKGPVIAFGIPMLILGVLIFDMIYITVSRIKNKLVTNVKEWLDFTGKDHFHHRLLHLGFQEEQAVVFIYIVCITLGLSALVLENVQDGFPVVVLMIQAALIFINVTFLMLVGRKLYIPIKELKKIFPNEKFVADNCEDEYISGDMLQKLLRKEQQYIEDEKDAEKLSEAILIMEEMKKKYARKFS